MTAPSSGGEPVEATDNDHDPLDDNLSGVDAGSFTIDSD